MKFSQIKEETFISVFTKKPLILRSLSPVYFNTRLFFQLSFIITVPFVVRAPKSEADRSRINISQWFL